MASPTELRQDPATRNWVVIAPERSRRPDSFGGPRRQKPDESGCPFCPGREAETPDEIWCLNAEDGSWQVRVVPNKFPVLAGSGNRRRHTSPEGFVSMPGVGRHEVVIESREHADDLATAREAAVRRVLEAYRFRYRALRDEGAAVIVIFRNHGPGAGTSIVHPHSQIVATPVVPIEFRHRFDVAMQHYDDLGTCLYLDIIDRELRDGRRIVLQSERFVAFQPFASMSPYETWVMPRFHQSSFGSVDDAALDELASALRAVLGGLHRALEDPDYNCVIYSAPPGDEDREYFVWHVRIVPRLLTPAGFELGSGVPVNPSRPEETATTLRRSIDEEVAAQRASARH
jgi:UDPglucose--hexose-1-phosphate uridylyltransferase